MTAETIEANEQPGGAGAGTRAYFTFLGAAGVAYLVLVVFIVVFGLYGDQLTSGVDSACAEAAFVNGKKMETAGNYELAIQRYRQALQGKFTDVQRQYQCERSIGEILYQLGRYQEAVDQYRRLSPEALTTPGHYTAYVSSLLNAKDYVNANRFGQVWLDLAVKENDPAQQAWSNAVLGRIDEDTGRVEEALEHYRTAEKLQPSSEAGISVARMLDRLGKKAEALRQLDEFLERTKSGQVYEDARKVRAGLVEKNPAAK